MSSDLLEAFGNASEQPPPAATKPSQGQSQQSTPFGDFDSFPTAQKVPGNPWQQPSGPALGSLDEDDDFGDFEDASETPPTSKPGQLSGLNKSIPQSSGSLSSFAPQTSSWSPSNPGQQDIFSSEWNSRSHQTPTSKPSDYQSAPNRTAAFSQARLDRIAPDPDVLFDAGRAGDDDDFGDFEGDLQISEPPPAARQDTNADLLGLQDDFSGLTVDKQSRGHVSTGSSSNVQHAFQENNQDSQRNLNQEATTRRPAKKSPAASFAVSKSSSKKPLPIQKNAEDSWDEFADWEPTAPQPTAPKSNPKSPVTDITSTIRSPLGAEPTTDGLPPTNVPPPAVLLSLFPPLFADAHEKLFKPLAAQTFQLKNRILSDPKVAEFLRGYLLLAVVAARVIAGRKYRWKRDAHLSQGMRIGPASSRGTSGMKLTGVDKGEVSKEDRESLDVVQAWREQVGRLRSAVAGVNSIQPSSSLGAVPDLQETMPVRIAKADEGAATAPQPCALCGLKRNERIGKVDGEVDDNFGEWWIEKSSMHRACRNFWEEHQSTLRQR